MLPSFSNSEPTFAHNINLHNLLKMCLYIELLQYNCHGETASINCRSSKQTNSSTFEQRCVLSGSLIGLNKKKYIMVSPKTSAR